MTGGTPTRFLLAGGTGLVGSALMARLSARKDVETVSLVRRTASPDDTPVDFDALTTDPAGTLDVGRIDVGVSCLGTTMRTAGSQQAFRRVDHDYVLAVALAARAAGATRFVLVSSAGAGGGGLYLRVKGEVEEAVGGLGFDRFDVARPGLLLGTRAESRPLERIAQAVAPLISPILRGPLAPYGSIRAEVVAAAVQRLALQREPGRYVHHVADLRRLGATA